MALAIPFDTLALVKELETAGVPPAQAEAHTRILTVAFQKVEDNRREELATKAEVDAVRREVVDLRRDMTRDMKELELRIAAEFAPLKWGMALTVGGIVALVVKGFLPQ